MKKAKVMLSVVGIFSIVSGALALRASKTNGKWYCSTQPTSSMFCIIRATTVAPVKMLYCTENPQANCTRQVMVRETM